MHMGVGTLACPDCDAPVFLGPRPMSPADPLWRGFCGRDGHVRDFLSLRGQPTRADARRGARQSGLPAARR